MLTESRICRYELHDLFPHLIQEFRLPQRLHGLVTQSMLPGSHQLTDSAAIHVFPGERKPVVDTRNQFESLQRTLRGIIRQQ